MLLEIDLHAEGDRVLISARGSRREAIRPRLLGAEHGVDALRDFTDKVRSAAERGRPLGEPLRARANALYEAVFLKHPEIASLRARHSEAAGGALLLRLGLGDAPLQAVPWEALCKPGEGMGFLASSPELLPVRGVTTSEPWAPREVSGPLRVLAVAPQSGSSLALLRGALDAEIKAGAIEWLEPLEGAAARKLPFLERLGRDPLPHAIHFLGHGAVERGVATLRLADEEDGGESWLPVELLAQQLKARHHQCLRLVVLEACEGASPGAFASAAEILARAGADAAVAHLWPVKADVARLFSTQLYRRLAGSKWGAVEIAQAVNEGRLMILAKFEGSAEAFSPVVYLRAPELAPLEGTPKAADLRLYEDTRKTAAVAPAEGKKVGSGRQALIAAGLTAIGLGVGGGIFWMNQWRGGKAEGSLAASPSASVAPTGPALSTMGSASTAPSAKALASKVVPPVVRAAAPKASAPDAGAPGPRCKAGTLRVEYTNDQALCAEVCRNPGSLSPAYGSALRWVVATPNGSLCSCLCDPG